MPPGNDDLGGQLGLQQQINDLISARSDLLREQGKLLSDQAKISQRLCRAMDSCNLQDQVQDSEQLRENMEEVADESERAAAGSEQAGFGIGSIIKTGVGLLGISSIFQTITGGVTGLFDIVTSVAKGIFSIGLSIIAIPFKLFGGLVAMAGNMTGGANELRIAMEEVRAEFGSLASNEGKALIGVVGDTRKQMKDLAGTGLRLSRVYGYGRKGLAEILKENAEVAKSLGIALNGLMKYFKESGVELAMFRRGLGLTAEIQGQMMEHFKLMGKDVVDSFREVGSYAINMGKQFGISSKVVGKTMGEMIANVDQFGHMATKEIAAVSTYAVKLGVDVKTLGGLVDKFMNFEDAAKSAADLAAAFGMNVDTMKLMNSENPAEIIDQLRNSFFATGRDIKDLTAAERKYLSQSTNLQGAALEAAFSMEKQGVQYSDIAAGAEDAEKKQLSQVEVMKELADNIKRLTHQGTRQFKSFFDAFMQGLARGITRSRPFRKMLRAIRRALVAVYRLGRDIGRMFVNAFPGVKRLFGGIRNLFDAKRFHKEIISPIRNAFATFMSDLSGDDPKTGVRAFLLRIKKAFTNWLGGGAGAGGEILGGVSDFFNAVKNVFMGLLPVVIEGLTWVIHKITDFIQTPPSAEMSAMWDALGDMFMGLFGELQDALAPVIPPLLEALSKLWNVVLIRLNELVDEYGPQLAALGSTLLGHIFSSTAFKVVMGAVGAYLVIKLAPVILGAIAGIIKMIRHLSPPAGADEDQVGAFGRLVNALNSLDWSAIGKLAVLMAMLGAFAYAFGKFVVIPMMAAIAEAGSISISSAVAFGIIAVALTLSAGAAIGAAVYITDMFPNTVLMKSIVGLGVLAGFMWVLGKVFASTIQDVVGAMGKTNPVAVGAVMAAMTSMIWALMVAIPIAAGLGTMLMSFPFGTAGVALIVAGFAILYTLITGFMDSLIPALIELDEADVGDPEGLKNKVQSMVGIVDALGAITGMNKAMAQVEGANPQDVLNMMEKNKEVVTLVICEARDLVDDIIDAVQDMSEGDIKKAAGAGKLFGAITAMIGAVAGPFNSMMEKFTQMEMTEEGFMTAADPEDVTREMKKLVPTMTGAITTIVETMKEHLPTLVKDILNVELPKITPEEMERKTKFLTVGIKIVSSFIKLIKDLVDILPMPADFKDFSGNNYRVKMLNDYKVQLKTFICDIIEVVTYGLGFMIHRLILAAKLLPNIPSGQIEDRFKAIVSVLEVIGKFANIMKTLTGLTGVSVKDVAEKNELSIFGASKVVSESIKLLVSDMSTMLQDNLPTLIGSMLDMLDDPQMKGLADKYKQHKSSLGMLGEIIGIMSNITDLMNKLGKGGAAGGTVMEGGIEMCCIPPSTIDDITGILPSIGRFADKFVELGPQMKSVKSVLKQNVDGTVKDIVTQIDRINNLAQKITDMSVDTALDEIAGAVATGGDARRVRIAPGMFEMNLTIKIEMDRYKMVKFLSNNRQALRTDTLKIKDKV